MARILKLSATASEREHMRAAASLEKMVKIQSAKQYYKAILTRWTQSFMASMGLGNIYFKQGQFALAEDFFEQAIMFNPGF